ncbi:MAG: hypothetical protein GY868_02045, partial [Deltaproteobacteria bacterium]|nr:hypothetical protein [Deltaproteobacteria bacterium]
MPKKSYLSMLLCSLFMLSFVGGAVRSSDAAIGGGFQHAAGKASGICFNDFNENAVYDQNERGIAGVELTLKKIMLLGFVKKTIETVMTDDNGTFSFTGLKRGLYVLEAAEPEGGVSTTKNRFMFRVGLFKRDITIHVGAFISMIPTPVLSPQVTLAATPAEVEAGDSVTLEWFSENSETVVIDQGIGEVDLQGMLEVTPQATTVYTITAKGAGGEATDSITVIVTEAEAAPPSEGVVNGTESHPSGSYGGGSTGG